MASVVPNLLVTFIQVFFLRRILNMKSNALPFCAKMAQCLQLRWTVLIMRLAESSIQFFWHRRHFVADCLSHRNRVLPPKNIAEIISQAVTEHYLQHSYGDYMESRLNSVS